MAKRNAGAAKLQKFLRDKKLPASAVARVLKVHRAQIGRWLSGTFVPRKWAQESIAVWTGNEVPVSAWPATRTHGKRRVKVVPFVDINAQRVDVPQ